MKLLKYPLDSETEKADRSFDALTDALIVIFLDGDSESLKINNDLKRKGATRIERLKDLQYKKEPLAGNITWNGNLDPFGDIKSFKEGMLKNNE